jgi:hypothetical protein
MQVEALQARRGRRQGVRSILTLARPPRLAERHPDLGADDPHIPLKIAQGYRSEGQAFTSSQRR